MDLDSKLKYNLKSYIENFLSPDQIKTGEIGIEIEVEGENLPNRVYKWWRVATDGSLRGPASEYVLTEPVLRKDLETALNYLNRIFKNNDTRLNFSRRTSTHVHINVQKLTVMQVLNFIVLYLILEETIVDLCREDRIGNSFCLRLKDAEYLIDFLKEFINIRYCSIFDMNTDIIRYASINLAALSRYGSLEFRSLEGTNDADRITQWVDLLLNIKQVSQTYKSPSDIVENISNLGLDKFLNTYFSEFSSKIKQVQDYREKINNSIWLIQSLAYEKPWKSLLKNPSIRKSKSKKKETLEADDWANELWGNNPPQYLERDEVVARIPEEIRERVRVRGRIREGVPPPRWEVNEARIIDEEEDGLF